MNKREKEVFQHQLDAEEDVLKELTKQYEAALKDINEKIQHLQTDELTQSRIYQIEYQNAVKGQIEAIIEKLRSDNYETLHQYLQDAYTDAYVGTAYNLAGQGIPLIMPIDQKAAVKAIITDSKIKEDLYTSLGVDAKALKKSIRQEITRGIASGMHYKDIARNISNASKAPLSRAFTIARTESHRIQQASTYDAQQAAKAKGADVVKQWDSTLDGSTRKMHRKLDGQIREIDEPFEVGGKKAMYPGKFGDPAEDCNCRCVSLTRAKWALDEDELETLKQRAKFFEIDKTKDFEEYKKKYLKAAEETAEKSEKTSTTTVAKRTNKSTTTEVEDSAESNNDSIELTQLRSRMSELDSEFDAATTLDEMIRVDEERKEISQKISEIRSKQLKEEQKQMILNTQKSIRSSGVIKKVDISKSDSKAAQAIQSAVDNFHDKYPDVVLDSLKLSANSMKGSVNTNAVSLGKTSDLSVIMNGAYFGNSFKLIDTINRQYEIGALSTNSIEGVVTHELGHALCNFYGINPSLIQAQIIKESGLSVDRFYYGLDKDLYDPVVHISTYGDGHPDEWFSECFADYMTSAKPKEVSKKAVKILKEMIDEKTK